MARALSEQRFRLVPANIPQGAQCLQRYAGNFGGPIWRTIDIIACPAFAADRLAVCLGEMTIGEFARRERARRRALRARPRR